MRRLAKGCQFKIFNDPWLQQPDEPLVCFQRFSKWLHSNGKLTWSDLAIDADLQPDTIRRQALKYLWLERFQRTKGYSASVPHHLIAPAEDGDPLSEVLESQATGVDAAQIRTHGAEEVAAQSYFAISGLYSRLLQHAEIAISNIDPTALSSMAEIKSLVSLTTDLQKAKVDLANQLLGIEELAKAVQELRKRK